jgi:cell division protein FtsL
MIILAVVLLSISCILLARGVYKLQKRVNDLHNETNNRVSEYYIELTQKIMMRFTN